MKKRLLTWIVIGVLLGLTACSSADTEGIGETGSVATEDVQGNETASKDAQTEVVEEETDSKGHIEIGQITEEQKNPFWSEEQQESTESETQENTSPTDRERFEEKVSYVSDEKPVNELVGKMVQGFCYRNQIAENWIDLGEEEFVVESASEQFNQGRWDITTGTLEGNIKEALRKEVGDSFVLKHYWENSYDIYRFTIVDIEKNTALGNKKETVEYGDTIRAIREQAVQPEYNEKLIGSFWVKCNENSIEWVKRDGEFTEEDIKAIEKVSPAYFNEYSGAWYGVYDGDYSYQVCFTAIIEEEDKPAFTIPEGWDYQFGAPRIGSFKDYDWDISASAIDMEGGSVFGYEDRLSAGCSTWCACNEYYRVAKVSSYLPAQGSITYGVENLNDEYRLDAWAEGVPGDGIGESFEIRELYLGGGDDIFRYNEMCIVNGYAKDEKTWQENNRVKSLKLYFFDEYMGTITLEDTMFPQYIDLSPVAMRVGNGCEAKFRFEIADVYKGTKYDDTCISGVVVEFEGRDAH